MTGQRKRNLSDAVELHNVQDDVFDLEWYDMGWGIKLTSGYDISNKKFSFRIEQHVL